MPSPRHYVFLFIPWAIRDRRLTTTRVESPNEVDLLGKLGEKSYKTMFSVASLIVFVWMNCTAVMAPGIPERGSK